MKKTKNTEIQPEIIQPTTLEKTRRPIFINTLNIFTEPAKRRYERHYKKSKKHLVLDLLFVVLILILIALNIILFTKSFPIEKISINLHENNTTDNTNTPAVIEEIKDTDLILNAEVKYFTITGDQIGIGPWPPQINETTNLRIFVNLKSTIHNVKDVNLQIKLPKDIKWTDNFVVNLGDPLVYNPTSNTISYFLEDLKPQELTEINFEIAITPTSENQNSKLKLIDWISVNANDVVTKNEIEKTLGNLFSPVVN
jgi:hypothetical protein